MWGEKKMVNIKGVIVGVFTGFLMAMVVGWFIGFLISLVYMSVYSLWLGVILCGVLGFIVGYQKVIEDEDTRVIREYELQQARRNL